MDNKWNQNPFELGLLNAGIRLAARLLLLPGPQVYYLTDFGGKAPHLPVFASISGDLWGFGVLSATPTSGPFPYGYVVEPR